MNTSSTTAPEGHSQHPQHVEHIEHIEYIEHSIPREELSYLKKVVWSLSFLLLGICFLSPWNIWIQQTDYFKLRLKGSWFVGTFEGLISVTFQIFNILTLIFLIGFPKLLSIRQRIVGSLTFTILVFILAAALILFAKQMDSNFYFMLTLILIALSSILTGLFPIGLAGSYPVFCMTAFNSGQGLAGLMPILLQMLFGIQFMIQYFAISILLVLLSLAAYSLLQTPDFSKLNEEYRELSQGSELEEEELNMLTPDLYHYRAGIDVFSTLYKIRFACGSVFLNLFLTLSVFPAITVSVQSTSNLSTLVLLHFLIFNLADFAGKTGTIFVSLSTKRVFVLSCFRSLFIPVILACNVVFYNRDGSAEGHFLPLLFGDTSFLIIMALFSLSNGCLTTLSFCQYPELLSDDPNALAVAGDLIQLSLTAGLALGSICSFGLQAISCQCNPFD